VPQASLPAALSPPAIIWPRYLLAALAIVPVLTTVYQTLVLTDVTDDVIRRGIDGGKYDMIWVNSCWGAAIVFGVFGALWAVARFGMRDTLMVGLVWFAAGNWLCGAAVDVPTQALAHAVEGIGKGMVIVLGRSLLYKQFDRAVIMAIGFYGVAAYATRPSTPLVTALINDLLSWRWIFWVNIPVALLGLALVRRFMRPDRPPKPLPMRIDWIAVSLLAGWAVAVLFAFGWYRKWGGWTSNTFTFLAVLSVVLPALLVLRVATGTSPDEHLRRIVRVRVYVLAMFVRLLLLLNLGVVLTLMAKYLVDLRVYPRELAGWILTPASLTMALSTFLTTYFRRRALRHFWLAVGVVGIGVTLWWLSGVDNFTPKQEVALRLGCWGLFVGLLPPSFLCDEVEGLNRRDVLYGGAIAVVCLILGMIMIPIMASTTVSAFTDAAVDAQRQNLRENRPAVEYTAAHIADY
jgi:MFS family permease